MQKFTYIISILFLFLIAGCSEKYSPRPKGYFRIDLPQAEYKQLPDSFPYSFKISNQAKIENEISRISRRYWINIVYPHLNASIHVSYYPVTNNLQQLLDDTHDLAYKHTIKADAIEENIINKPEKKVYGTFYKIEGNTANNLQFYLTDSSKHYFRAALYFNSEPNIDSIQPVLKYLENDMNKLIETFSWN